MVVPTHPLKVMIKVMIYNEMKLLLEDTIFL